MNNKGAALVIFKEDIPKRGKKWWRQFDTIVASDKFEMIVKKNNLDFKDIKEFVDYGSIYEASAFLEELSHLSLPDGARLPKSFVYKGYELWWLHYENLFLYFCLPYTQYKKLLEYLKNFERVYFYCPPYQSLFLCYLQAHGIKMEVLKERKIRSLSILPFGVFIQILLTLISLPILMIRRRRALLFTGDKFEKGKDHDFRMRIVYEEMRRKNIPFIEFIRGLESWKTVLQHAFIRRRPVVYSETAAFLGVFLSVISGGRALAKQKFGAHIFVSENNPEMRFKLLVATQYLLGIYDDIWAIRIMRWILRVTGVKVAFIAAATKRNFHTVLGCKLNNIPTIGILHGVASRFYNVYDFLPGFDGEKALSVDKYGLWSEWWKEYYLKYSKAYHSEQLFVSGPMRPLERKSNKSDQQQGEDKKIKVLFVPGELSNPLETMPYLEDLMRANDISVYLTFRPYRDNFKIWLNKHKPELIDELGKKNILSENIHAAIANCDVIVGTYSTGALEALLQLKPVIFFGTKKWGDYFSMREYSQTFKFFVESRGELLDSIRKSKEIPINILKNLQEKFFGNPDKNGSKWVVEQMERYL